MLPVLLKDCVTDTNEPECWSNSSASWRNTPASGSDGRPRLRGLGARTGAIELLQYAEGKCPGSDAATRERQHQEDVVVETRVHPPDVTRTGVSGGRQAARRFAIFPPGHGPD